MASAPADLLLDAERLFRKGDYEGARQKFEAAVKSDPKSIEACAGLARVYLKQEKVRQAADTISKAAEFAGDQPIIRTARGEVYFREGKIAEAEREFVSAVNANPSLARPRLGLARIYRVLSFYGRAKGMIDSAHQLDAEDPDIDYFWSSTLPLEEKIKVFEARLAETSDKTPEYREELTKYVDYLKVVEAGHPHSCQLANRFASTEIKLEPLLMDATHLRGYGLAVTVNGEKARPMLDTGSSGLLINRRIAEKAGIKKIYASKVGGIGGKGSSDSYIGYADSIKIGNLEFRNCQVEVLEKRSVAGDDGLIGADVFEGFLVDLDFPNRKLKLTELPQRPKEAAEPASLQAGGDNSKKPDSADSGPQDRYIAPEMQSYTRVYRFDHMLLVPTKVNDSVSKLFLIDTGSLTNNISPDAAREITKVRGDPDMSVEGLSGYVKKVYSADKVVLQFGHLRQRNEDLNSFDLSSVSRSAATEISGTLGFVMLHFLEVKIDYRDGLVDFHYAAEPGR